MLIDLRDTSPFTIDPAAYPTTLAIAVTVREGQEHEQKYGLFAGQHADMDLAEEEGCRCPVVEDLGYSQLVFVLDRPESRLRPSCVERYHYVVLGWKEGVYVQMPVAWALTLSESSREGWKVYVNGVTVCLPDYEPGWGARRCMARDAIPC